MAKLKLVIPKGDVPNWLKTIFLTIENWGKNISGECLTDGSVGNEKLANGISGAKLRDGSVPGVKLGESSVTDAKLADGISGGKLANWSVALNRVAWPEWHIPLALPVEDFLTDSSDFYRCSGIFLWDPSAYPTTGGTWHFEASIAISDERYTVYARLVGSSVIGTVSHSGDTDMALVRSGPLAMPGSPQNLYCEFRRNASIGSFCGARLVFVPG